MCMIKYAINLPKDAVFSYVCSSGCSRWASNSLADILVVFCGETEIGDFFSLPFEYMTTSFAEGVYLLFRRLLNNLCHNIYQEYNIDN